VSGEAPRPEPPHPGEPAERPPPTPSLGDLFWVGTACALSVVIAGAAGYFLDAWLGTAPWLTFAGLAFGVVSAVMLGYKAVQRYT
jgi:Putative F0F1-ATPase subunit Ca2+/Mg2+ transporter